MKLYLAAMVSLLGVLSLAVLWVVASGSRHPKQNGGSVGGSRRKEGGEAGSHHKHAHRSVHGFDTIDKDKHFSVVTMSLDHHADGSWVVPSLHHRGSAGWNRTIIKGNLQRPYACTLQFFGLGLESTLEGFMKGGTGYLQLEVKQFNKEGKEGRSFWYGFDGNEQQKLHCYYMTSKGYGSEFLDNPKTLGIAIYCPVDLDLEVGEYEFRKIMEPGFYCRSIADNVVNYELHLRPSDFTIVSAEDVEQHPDLYQNSSALLPKMTAQAKLFKEREIVGEFTSKPAAPRAQALKELALDRRHAVVTVRIYLFYVLPTYLSSFHLSFSCLRWYLCLSLSLSIYYCLLAFSDATWHESNHHPLPPQSINQSIVNRHHTHITDYLTDTVSWMESMEVHSHVTMTPTTKTRCSFSPL